MFVSGPVDDISTVRRLAPMSLKKIWRLMFKSRHSFTLIPQRVFSFFLKRSANIKRRCTHSGALENNTTLLNGMGSFAWVDLGQTLEKWSRYAKSQNQNQWKSFRPTEFRPLGLRDFVGRILPQLLCVPSLVLIWFFVDYYSSKWAGSIRKPSTICT